MDVADAKRVLRRRALGARGRLGAQERERLGALISDRVVALEEVAAATTVLAYASFGAEVPTDGIIERLLAAGKTVLLPAVDGDRIQAAPVGSLAEVAPGYRGIREPIRRDPVPTAAGVILVPGVAFDAAGRRLGFGGGFYDRYLAGTTGLRIGLCFEVQIADEVPAGPDDVAVEVIATEARTLRPGRR